MVLIFHMSRTKSQKFNLPKDMLLTKSWLWIKPRSNAKVIFLEGKGEISGRWKCSLRLLRVPASMNSRRDHFLSSLTFWPRPIYERPLLTSSRRNQPCPISWGLGDEVMRTSMAVLTVPMGRGSLQKRGVWTEKHPKKACQNHQGPRDSL